MVPVLRFAAFRSQGRWASRKPCDEHHIERALGGHEWNPHQDRAHHVGSRDDNKGREASEENPAGGMYEGVWSLVVDL